MTTKTIIITALPSGRGGLESSILAVKRPTTSSFSNIVSAPSPVLFTTSSTNIANSMPKIQKIEQYESYDDDEDDYEDDLMEPPRKRERLTHLSAEEKLFRRKMKNRIAAQTARDRKKAHMGDLEDRIRRLEAENATLKAENVQLKMKSGKLNEENGRLKIELDENEMSQIVSYDQRQQHTNVADIGIQQSVEVLGSAASINVPQQKEQTTPMWILNWLLVALTAMTSSNSCNNSSETAETICKTEALSVIEIRNRIKNLPISNAGKTVLLSKLTELLNMWKATRKKEQMA
jgi:hypothetical protein